MNIFTSILIAILTIFALKRHNSAQENGIGNKRFIIAIVCGAFPYIDNVFGLFDKSIQLAYQNTFLWSFLLIPAYALAFTMIFKTWFGEKVDPKFLYIGILGSMMIVAFFNLLGNDGLAILYPVTDLKVALHLMHSFDLILFLICLTGVILLVTSKRHRRDIARGFMALFTIYVIAVASFSYKARLAAYDYANALNLKVEKVYTIAQPLSVFNWRVMVFTEDKKIHDSFITLKDEQLQFEDGRANRVAKLYKPAKKAVWRIYRQVHPYYQAQYDAVQKHYGDNPIAQDLLKFSILKDSINYKQYRCLRFKDLRTEGVRKSLKGNTLFCQNPKTKSVKVLAGSKEKYEDISNLFN
tara:strand:- start:2322 stop:3383 length:1062 start_codon:yes stop_codon:yes gene_type:complete